MPENIIVFRRKRCAYCGQTRPISVKQCQSCGAMVFPPIEFTGTVQVNGDVAVKPIEED